MITTLEKSELRTTNQNIPKYLIREEIDGQLYYYKDYKAVLNQTKKAAEIMGASGLQSFIIQILMKFLFRNADDKRYHFMTNEVGGHLKKRTNLSYDLAIFDKTVLTFDKINDRYIDVPPKIVVEIDVKIETEDQTDFDYMTQKTDKLLTFGTERVIWILSKSKKIIVATPNENWQVMNWDKDFELIDGLMINLDKLFEDEGFVGINS
jgi:Uma2 family endonuclease